MEESALDVSRKLIKDIADGAIGNELDASITRCIRVVKAHKGFILCDFIIHKDFLDANGNWHVGAIATLVQLIGSCTAYSLTSYYHAALDFCISYYSTAKVQEEVEVEAKDIGKKGKLTSVNVEVRKKENGELVAVAKLWMAEVRRNIRHQASKL